MPKITKTVKITVRQPSGRFKIFWREILPGSRIGMMFFPTGELGQIEEVRLRYSDGHTRTYELDERVDPLAGP